MSSGKQNTVVSSFTTAEAKEISFEAVGANLVIYYGTLTEGRSH